MKQINIDSLIEKIYECVQAHRLSEGCYSRYIFGEGKDLGKNEYGCADAANILYTIGRFPSDPKTRAEWIRNLQEMQNKETGLFNEKTHHPIHTTAHCSAALGLFDAKPLYEIEALREFTTKEGLYRLLEKEVKWTDNTWRESHKGAGILPCLTNTDMVGLEWKNWYFEWMWEHTDEKTGFFWGIEEDSNVEPLYRHMAGGFHYLFNHEAEHRPLRCPEKIIDSCFEILNDSEIRPKFTASCGFIDIDIVYCFTRAMRQTPHRFYEIKETLEEFADKYIEMMFNIDYQSNKYFNDLHCLFGAVCCLAELQAALPGKIITSKPLKLVLDRRPFI